MARARISKERLTLLTDGLFAVVITILVLEIKPPNGTTFADLLPLWPVALSYVISYFFIAIVWINHHHLFGYAEASSQRLVWFNFAHLFAVSLIPFTTQWVAESELGAVPVSLYAAVFLLVNLTYLALCWEVLDRAGSDAVPLRARNLLRMRSVASAIIFAIAGMAGARWPIVGMVLIVFCLVLYVRPDLPGGRSTSDVAVDNLS